MARYVIELECTPQQMEDLRESHGVDLLVLSEDPATNPDYAKPFVQATDVTPEAYVPPAGAEPVGQVRLFLVRAGGPPIDGTRRELIALADRITAAVRNPSVIQVPSPAKV